MKKALIAILISAASVTAVAILLKHALPNYLFYPEVFFVQD